MVKVDTILATLQAVVFRSQDVARDLSLRTRQTTDCLQNGNGLYQMTVVDLVLPSKRDLGRRTECGADELVVALGTGVLTNTKSQIAAVNVTNQEFFFVNPPIPADLGLLSNWSVCPNASLAIGLVADFWQCLSGTSYNLYIEPSGVDCINVKLEVTPCPGISSTISTSAMFSSLAPLSSTTHLTPGVSSVTSAILATTASVPQSSAAAASSSSRDSEQPNFALGDGLGVGLGIGIPLLLGALVVSWLLLRTIIAIRKSRVYKSEPGVAEDHEPDIAEDQEPGVAVSETEYAGVFVR